MFFSGHISRPCLWVALTYRVAVYISLNLQAQVRGGRDGLVLTHICFIHIANPHLCMYWNSNSIKVWTGFIICGPRSRTKKRKACNNSVSQTKTPTYHISVMNMPPTSLGNGTKISSWQHRAEFYLFPDRLHLRSFHSAERNSHWPGSQVEKLYHGSKTGCCSHTLI